MAVAVWCTACSMFMDEVPESWDPSQGAPACTTSETAPAADLALAVPLLLAAATYIGFGLADDETCGENDCAVGGVFLLAAMPYKWSGLHGARVARRCRDARRAARQWDARHPVVTAKQRLEHARRRAAERRRIRRWIRRWGSLQCARLVGEWHAEDDKVHKRILFDRMPDDCRDRVHPPRR